MAEITKLYQITSLPGIKRDGTNLDGDNYMDGQWVRFNRGKPRKMGGYQESPSNIPGPIRGVMVWSRGPFNAVICSSHSAITQSHMDQNGGSGTVYDRTPPGLPSLDGCWTLDSMYDSAFGSESTLIFAHRNGSLGSIDELTDYPVYCGVANDTTAFEAIPGLAISGGVVCIAPYLVYYGSDGLVGWSDANQPKTLNSGDAGTARVTGSKIVKGLPLRTGSGPSALLWSLDSVIQMTYAGGNDIFSFSLISSQSSILAQNSVIEYDGDYFWIGIDRFLVYSGGKVQELSNQMNKNWFFDNLNYSQRQKVWVTKVPRFGEIIWHFPKGDSTECNHAIVFNVLEKVWYDFELSRTAGYYSQVFHYPIWAGDSTQLKSKITLQGFSGAYQVGDVVSGLSGSSSGVYVVGLVVDSSTIVLYGEGVSRSAPLVVGEMLSNLTQGFTAQITSVVEIHSAYVHEKGLNAVTQVGERAIRSFIETSDFGYPTGGAQQNNIEGLNRWTRLVRVEPDFLMSGNMQLQVIHREFAQQSDTVSEPFTFSRDTGKIDMRKQGRQIRLRFTCDTLGGNFEMGRVILHTEPGEVRS